MTYALNQWQALRRHTDDGRLTIDNKVSERRLRDQAIGRKNWMFLGSAEAGLCTVIAGAKRHWLEPWAYLHDVILQLSVDASPESLARLLPDHWALGCPQRTTPSSRPPSGFVTITHPHHPLRGQRVEIVRIRRGNDPDLIVVAPDGRHTAIALSSTDYSSSAESPPAMAAKLEGQTRWPGWKQVLCH